MDAVEAVARKLARLEKDQEWPDITDFAEQFEHLPPDTHRTEMRAQAEWLISAFPQLALEPRDEWGRSRFGKFTADLSDEDRLFASHRRTVWESPWVQVES